MPFNLTVETVEGEFNWFGLPDTDRAGVEEIREKFNLAQFRTGENLIIDGLTTTFDRPWTDILSITIDG